MYGDGWKGGDGEALAGSLGLPQAHLGPLSPGSSLVWVLRLVQAKSGGGGRIIYFDTIRAFPPTAAAILGAPESRGMVKLGNVAPEGMCVAVGPRLQGEDSRFTPYKIKLQLGKEQHRSLYKAMEEEAAGSCHWGSEGGGPRPLWSLADPAGACDGAEGQGCCVLSSKPLAATEAGGAWGGVMHGKDGFAGLASNPSLLVTQPHWTSVLPVVK